MNAKKQIGLIAGQGELPIAIADEARQLGYSVFAIGLDPLVDDKLADFVDHFTKISVGKLGSIIKTLKKASIKEAVMGGKVSKTLLFKSKIVPDLKAVGLLFKLKDKKDDSILLAIVEEFKKEGIDFLGIPVFTSKLIAPKGVMTKKGLSKHEEKDIEFGLPLAKEIGRLDIGQTIVVKDQAIMSVEAIEGTDSAIIRGGSLAEDGAVVIKVAKPNQDTRFDYPAVGLDTLNSMIKGRARVLAVEADNILMMQKDKMIQLADESGITIFGI